MGSFVAEISQRIKSDLSLPVGYSVVYGPTPVANNIGTKPNAAIEAVINTGRNLDNAPLNTVVLLQRLVNALNLILVCLWVIQWFMVVSLKTNNALKQN
jgi:hypothetical protein